MRHWIAFLHTLVVADGQKFPVLRQRGPDGDATFGETLPGLRNGRVINS